jgi:hypothetical protein
MSKTLFGDKMAGFKLPIDLGALASGATNTTQESATVFVAPHDLKLAAAYAIFISALTGGSAANYIGFSIINKGTDGNGTTEMARLNFTSAITVDDDVPKAFTLSTTAANLLLSAGEAVAVYALPVASGLAYPIGNFSVHFTMQ